MTKEEARSECRRMADVLMTPTDPESPELAPIVALDWELEDIAKLLKTPKGKFKKNAEVEKYLRDSAMLVRALTAPTRVSWSEPSGETERDPVSGNPRPKMTLRHEAAPYAQGVYEIKCGFVACTRTLAAFAKHIDSPAYDEWRDIYIALEQYFAQNSIIDEMDDDFATEIVARFDKALFTLWADNEIAKEVRHV